MKKRIDYRPFTMDFGLKSTVQSLMSAFIIFSALGGSFFIASQARGDITGEQLKSLKEISPEFQKKVREKEKDLLKMDPTLKERIHRPNPTNVLENVRKEKLKRYSPEVSAMIPDTVKILAIRVDFQEEIPDTPCTTGNGKFDLDGNDLSPLCPDGSHDLCYDPPHTKGYFEAQLEAVRNYYWKTSEKTLYLDYTVIPGGESASYTLPNHMAFYGDPYNIGDGLTFFLLDVIEAVDDSVDFSTGGEFDPQKTVFILFHAGSMWQTDFFFDSFCDLPAVFIGFIGGGIPTDDGSEITGAVVFSETAFQDFSSTACDDYVGCPGFMQGGLVHEVAHAFGGGVVASKVIPDLYDISFETPGMGGWSLMGSGNWNLSGLVPPHHDAWNSTQLRFIDPVVIDHETTGVQIWRRGADTTGVTKIVKIPVNSHEYFLVENRYTYLADTASFTPDSSLARVWQNNVLVYVNDYDYSLPSYPPYEDQGGLAIWHIDEEITEDTLLRIYSEINIGGRTFGVDMEEGDGVQNFQTPYFQATDFNAAFYGTPEDVFYKGNPFPTGDRNNVAFTPFSTPNTGANSGAVSLISIENISAPDSMFMTFDVRFDWNQTGFPKSLIGPTDVNSPYVVDLNGDDTLEILIVTSSPFLSNNITVNAWKADGNSYTGDPQGRFALPLVQDSTFSSLSIGDITGDGRLEVVTATLEGSIHAWHADSFSGTFARAVFGFPIATGGLILSPILLQDVDGDGVLDIIVGSDDRKVYAWHWDTVTNSPQSVNFFPLNIGREVWTTPLVIDSTLYVFPIDGRLHTYNINTGAKLWTELPENVAFTTSSPVAGDMDADSVMEIIVLQGTGKVFSVDETGEIEWQATLPDTARFSTPALADLDGDGYLDVVFAAGRRIYAFNRNGSNLDYFPIDTESDTNEIQSSPVVGDIDGDGRMEVLIGTLDDRLLAYHASNGKMVAGFPLGRGNKIFSTPTLTDLDKDGDIEIAIGSDDMTLQVFDLPSTYVASNIPWGMLHRDLTHSRVVPLNETPTPKPLPISLLAPKPFYSYPNPVTGSTMKVRYLLGKPADEVDIKIFNLAGDLIKELKGNTGEGILETEINLGGMASGVYIYRIEAKKGSEKSILKKKFAITR